MASKIKNPRVMHRIPGRIRLRLPALSEGDARDLVQDLKVSPDVRNVTLRGSSLIIEHNTDDRVLTNLGAYLSKRFPGFERWSDQVDSEIAKAVSDPWINKSVPLAFLGMAIYRGLIDGAFLAGESAFALTYIAFDLYWKFQQENVIHKIETGLSTRERSQME